MATEESAMKLDLITMRGDALDPDNFSVLVQSFSKLRSSPNKRTKVKTIDHGVGPQ